MQGKAPLTEPVADDPHSSWVTFVWRGDGKTQRMNVQGGPSTGDFADWMKQLGNTDLWYRTVRIPNDSRFVLDRSWYDGKDPCCYNDPDGWRYTGPDEIWWAPYDNRPKASNSDALPDYVPKGLLLPFTEGNVSVFRCPVGVDYYSGKPPQVSYAWSGITLGPEGKRLSDIANGNGTSNVVTAWEHADGPQCWYGPVHNRTWNPVDADIPPMHYPLWHPPVCHFLFCDGHVAGLMREEIVRSLLYVNTPPESSAGR
jgi:prepilin-type processing-associated H-X9-DG protein